MIHNKKSFGNVIYTEITLNVNEISDRNTFETNVWINQNKISNNVYINQNKISNNVYIDQNKISNNVQITTGLNKQLLSTGDGLLFINNKFQTILI